MNPYVLANLNGVDQRLLRVLQDMTDRINFLSKESESVSAVAPIRRPSTTEGIITIPCRSDGGLDGAIRVNKDGTIFSYISPAESTFPYIDSSTVGNVGAGLDILHSLTIPANVLSADGEYFKFYYGGNLAANDNDKRIVTEFDSQVIFDSSLLDLDGGGGKGSWSIATEISRTSPTAVRFTSRIIVGQLIVDGAGAVNAANSNCIFAARTGTLTVSNLNVTSVVARVRAEATANDDVTQSLSIVEYYKPRTKKLV